LHSYRDLPLRYGEFGQCHRNEPSGALHGMMRVRGFTQDDGHIFCTEDQVQEEVAAFDKIVREVYTHFGFVDVQIKLALRPEKRIGEDEVWDKSESALREAIRASGSQWEELPGEGAFYGPKIEYHLKDSIGRSWQCGTMQVDFPCRNVWARNMLRKTTTARCRSCCTGLSSVRSSVSSRF